MTKNEKLILQRKIVKDLFKSLETVPEGKKEYLTYFKNQIRELFKLEMRFYGFVCDKKNTRYNEINLIFKNDSSRCSRWVAYYKGGFYNNKRHKMTSPSSIVINNKYQVSDLFSDDINIRMKACRDVLKSLFHEIRHFRQHVMMESGYTCYHDLRRAREEAIHHANPEEFYKYNHCQYSAEADANVSAYRRLSDLKIGDEYTKFGYLLNCSDRDVSYILVNDKGLVDRDTYISDECDKVMKNRGLFCSFRGEPILKKEYDSWGDPIPLATLIKNYKNETLDVKNSGAFDDKTKRRMLKDIKVLYYELFDKRIRKFDLFELYEAYKAHGYKEIQKLLNNLSLYNKREKERKLDLLTSKKYNLILYRTNLSDYFRYIDEGIADPERKYRKAIDTKVYVRRMGFSHANPDIDEFLKSNAFRSKLPLDGYYMTHEGKRMSINYFVKYFLIPQLEMTPNKKDYYKAMFISLKRLVVPSSDMEAAKCMSFVNENFHELDGKIFDFMMFINYPLIKTVDENDLDNYKMVAQLINNDINALHFFDVVRTKLDGKYYYLYTEEQIEWAKEINEAAMKLNGDRLFNPLYVNYYYKLMNNTNWKKVLKEMERYKTYLSNKGLTLR